MLQSHAAGRTSEPTFAQLKEFFAQVESGRVTKERLQEFLREEIQIVDTPSLEAWMSENGFIPANQVGFATDTRSHNEVGFLLPDPVRRWSFLHPRRPFIATLDRRSNTHWKIEVFGREHLFRMQEVVRVLKKLYKVKIDLELKTEQPLTEALTSHERWNTD